MRIQRQNKTGDWRIVANVNNHRTFTVDNTVVVEGNTLDEKTGDPITYRVAFSVGEFRHIKDRIEADEIVARHNRTGGPAELRKLFGPLCK
jgi:hypothetical protein